MGERLLVLTGSADKGAIVIGDVIVTSILLPFLFFFLTRTPVMEKRDHDKTDAWDSDGGGGGGGHH